MLLPFCLSESSFCSALKRLLEGHAHLAIRDIALSIGARPQSGLVPLLCIFKVRRVIAPLCEARVKMGAQASHRTLSGIPEGMTHVAVAPFSLMIANEALLPE